MIERQPSETDISRLLQLAGRRPAVPADAAARVHDAVRAQWKAAVMARRRRRMAAASVAAAVAIAAFLLVPGPPAPSPVPTHAAVVERVTGGGLSMVGAPAEPLAPGGRVPVESWLETARDGRASLRIAGGGLRLDRDTRLEVLSPSSVWLERGGVYVESEGGASSAVLTIHTREGQVTHVGTQFQVRAAATGVRVHVREGRVFVLGRSGRHEATAGTRLDVAGSSVRRSDAPGHGAEWAWVEEAAPEYAIEGRSLDAFLRWASRETGLRVRFQDESLERAARDTVLHGSSRGLTASQAIEAVLPASGLASRRRGDTLWIVRGPQEVR
jgi:ferric-dicitrate binding protein FerR (iron transport regulator)